MKITKYSRSNGCEAFAMNLFGEPDRLRDLLSSELDWYWASARPRPVEDPQFSSRPAEVRMTPVNAQSIDILIDDFRERDVDGYGRTIDLLGCDLNADIRSPQALEFALKTFAALEHGPLRIVVIQVGDSPEYIFVPHHPVESVATLLDGWGITSGALATKPYARLHTVKLELLIPGSLKLAFGDD